MANYGSNAVVIEADVVDGGALVNISQFVKTFNGVDIERMLEDTHAFGDSWTEQLFTGLQSGGEITFGGDYDDGANVHGAWFLPAPLTARSFRVTWGGAKTTSFEMNVMKRRRGAELGALNKYEITARITGAVTEA